MSAERVPAVVLAGGRIKDDLAQLAAVDNRALIQIGSRRLGEVVLSALRDARGIGEIALVAPAAVREAMPAGSFDHGVEASGTLTDNLRRGIQALGAEGPVLSITCDLPFISGAALDRYLEGALARDAVVVYPVVPREANDRRFPGTKRTFVHLREGCFTGGNLVLVSGRFIITQGALIERLFAARKSPPRLAAILGLGFLFGIITGRLRLADIEARMGRILGAPAAALVCDDPEIGFDIDKVSDLEYVRRELGEGG
jgi:GTP:adenosylcobinamide-phosphate guanylyltransferase